MRKVAKNTKTFTDIVTVFYLLVIIFAVWFALFKWPQYKYALHTKQKIFSNQKENTR